MDRTLLSQYKIELVTKFDQREALDDTSDRYGACFKMCIAWVHEVNFSWDADALRRCVRFPYGGSNDAISIWANKSISDQELANSVSEIAPAVNRDTATIITMVDFDSKQQGSHTVAVSPIFRMSSSSEYLVYYLDPNAGVHLIRARSEDGIQAGVTQCINTSLSSIKYKESRTLFVNDSLSGKLVSKRFHSFILSREHLQDKLCKLLPAEKQKDILLETIKSNMKELPDEKLLSLYEAILSAEDLLKEKPQLANQELVMSILRLATEDSVPNYVAAKFVSPQTPQPPNTTGTPASSEDGLSYDDIRYNLDMADEKIEFIDLTEGIPPDWQSYQNWKGNTAVAVLKQEVDSEMIYHAVTLAKVANELGGYDVVIIDPLSDKSEYKDQLEALAKSINQGNNRCQGVIYTNLENPTADVCADLSMILARQISKNLGTGASLKYVCLQQVSELDKDMYPHGHPVVESFTTGVEVTPTKSSQEQVAKAKHDVVTEPIAYKTLTEQVGKNRVWRDIIKKSLEEACHGYDSVCSEVDRKIGEYFGKERASGKMPNLSDIQVMITKTAKEELEQKKKVVDQTVVERVEADLRVGIR